MLVLAAVLTLATSGIAAALVAGRDPASRPGRFLRDAQRRWEDARTWLGGLGEDLTLLKTLLETAFGRERVEQRAEDYRRLLERHREKTASPPPSPSPSPSVELPPPETRKKM